MKTKEEYKEEVIEYTKEFVAKEMGFDKSLGTRWKTAMLLTHRRKSQIQLFEVVIDFLVERIHYLDEKLSQSSGGKN